MEYVIEIPQLRKQFNIDVSYGDTFKSAKNRSYASASPYSETGRLVQKKFCSDTGKEVDNSEVTHSIYKVGKQEFRIPKDRLKQIRDSIASGSTDIKVKAILKKDVVLPIHRVSGAKYIEPAKKRARDFVELREYCKDFYLVGEAVFKSNSYEVVLTTYQEKVVLIMMASEDRMSKSPDLDGLQGIELDATILGMEKKLLEKNSTTEYNWTDFVDMRQEKEDELIEKIAIDGEEMPLIVDKPTPEATETATESRLEELKKMLEESEASA